MVIALLHKINPNSGNFAGDRAKARIVEIMRSGMRAGGPAFEFEIRGAPSLKLFQGRGF
jgi:hypothetical protein